MAEPRSASSYIQLDTSGLAGIVQGQQEYNRKINAEKSARSATGASKINESFDKLNKKVWERDNQHMSNMVRETEDWMADVYSKKGETAIYDDPQLKAEFNKKISNIKNFAEMSRSQQAMGNKQLEERAENPDELDYESASNFDEWADLPPSKRVLVPVPMISKRHTTLSESVNKYGKQHLSGLLTEFDYDSQADEETGEYKSYEGKRLDKKRLEELVNGYNTNPNSVIFRTADRETKEDFDYEQTAPTMLDADGNEVPNPEFQKKLSEARAKRIEEEILKQAGREYTKSSKKFVPGSTKKEAEVEITEVSEDDSGYTTEEIPAFFKSNKYIASTGKDKTGKQYFKLKTPMYVYEGEMYEKENLPEGITTSDASEVPIGSWVDRDKNVLPDDSEITETKKTKTTSATREYNVTTPGKAKIVNITKHYNEDGSVVEVKEGTALKGQFIGNVNVDGEDRAKIRNSKGEVVIIPATDDVKKVFKVEYDKIESAEKEKRGKELSGEEKPSNKYGI